MFSRKKQKKQALDLLIRHAQQNAKNKHPEFLINHNDEVKDAQNGNFTKLEARITKQFNDKYNKTMKYREEHWK